MNLRCNLISDRGEDETGGNEEFCGTRVKLSDDIRHVPLKVSPDVLVCRDDKNRSQTSKSPNNRESKDLVRPLELVLGEPTEIYGLSQH